MGCRILADGLYDINRGYPLKFIVVERYNRRYLQIFFDSDFQFIAAEFFCIGVMDAGFFALQMKYSERHKIDKKRLRLHVYLDTLISIDISFNKLTLKTKNCLIILLRRGCSF